MEKAYNITTDMRKWLERVGKGFVTADRVMGNNALHDLAVDGFIDTHNFGHFRATVFLTDKGRAALEERDDT